jgi:hypothetical protein
MISQPLAEILVFRLSNVDQTEIIVERVDATLFPYVRFNRPGSDGNLSQKLASVAATGFAPFNNFWIPELAIGLDQHMLVSKITRGERGIIDSGSKAGGVS